jgi:hypothetical protein
MIIVSIDPGSNGGCVAMKDNKEILYQFAFKLNQENEFDMYHFIDNIYNLENVFEKYDTHNVTFIIENVHSLFGMSAKSNFSFGKNCGIIEAVIATRGYKFIKVTPKDWQKEMLKGIPVIKKTKKGIESKKNDVKAMSLMAQQKLFPDFNSLASSKCRTPHDGLVDALLIADYGRQILCTTQP